MLVFTKYIHLMKVHVTPNGAHDNIVIIFAHNNHHYLSLKSSNSFVIEFQT